MTVEFWLVNGKTRLRLPVNPESNSYVSPFSFTDTEVEGLGEITTIGRRGLREFTISTFWPRDYNPTYCSYSTFTTPQRFINYIENWRNGRKPIQLIITGEGGVNISATIREFDVEAERGGSPGDVYFTLVLKEWRELKVTKVDTSKPAKKPTTSASRPSAAKPAKVTSYTVKANDSLWKIAKRPEIYGDGDQWRRIYNANVKVIGKNPNSIKAGQKLVIPR
ncbi:LysM peptidoglycan-binding domain-containing protein [Peribacillus huizhouensis]|uniref:LysM domain-containing protein n=1 Tax=Peribacillus huizhouensis TaxID=1501239 RepID=A0ABR6CR52_9BACI|nr:LysM peptidoglycan-binding domain-containing protein [Peribacillus huizhouensis]MBA9027513.1 hypothetical protein [Peribacillus huizhouensis]